jgi:hypothetical protein
VHGAATVAGERAVEPAVDAKPRDREVVERRVALAAGRAGDDDLAARRDGDGAGLVVAVAEVDDRVTIAREARVEPPVWQERATANTTLSCPSDPRRVKPAATIFPSRATATSNASAPRCGNVVWAMPPAPNVRSRAPPGR